MCEAHLGTAIRSSFCALAIMGTAHTAGGQDAARMRARLLEAVRAEHAAADTLLALRQRGRLDLPPDSLVAGTIVVRYDARELSGSSLEATAAGARLAFQEMQDYLGDGAALVGSSAPIIARKIPSVAGFTTQGLEFSLPHAPGRNAHTGLPILPRTVANAMAELLGSFASEHVPTPIRQWSRDWNPVRSVDHAAWERAAVDLATSNSAATRACHAGGVAQCASALGLTAVRDPLTEWYSPEDWRVLVSSWTPGGLDVPAQRERAACLDDRELRLCERLSRRRNIPIPLTIGTRQTMYDLALSKGGTGAFTRMHHADGTALDILAATAGTTPDSLVSEWRARVLAAAPRETRPGALEATLALAWTLAFGVAATRSRP